MIEKATLDKVAAFVKMRSKLRPHDQYRLIAEVRYGDILEGLQVLMESLPEEEDRRYAANIERWLIQNHSFLRGPIVG